MTWSCEHMHLKVWPDIKRQRLKLAEKHDQYVCITHVKSHATHHLQ